MTDTVMAPFDATKLARVRKLPSRYRVVPSARDAKS
jgi:hypothetical protein